MATWTSGYVAEIDYTHGFYRELTPNLLTLIALLKGKRAATGPLSYCELGCGQGFSANLLAAANPEIQFYATDFNPTQIANAKALADEAGTPNVHFFDSSFEEFGAQPSLPAAFDVIALHGIYSWISAENRRHIVDFIRQKLKPGGLVYISYNVLPGWAAALPLRRLLVDAAAGGGTIGQRIDTAIAFAERVRDQGAAYFKQNPTVGPRLEKIGPMSRNYLAHEYFNKDWTPFYFADVAAELSDAKLAFLGSAHVLDHIDAINFNSEQVALLTGMGDPVRTESIRDVLINQQFRRDVFCRGAAGLGVPEIREAWLDQRFALTTPAADVPMKVLGALGEATMHEETYRPVLAGFAQGPLTLRQLLATHPAVAALNSASLMQALTVLVGAGHLQPALPAKDDSRRQTRTRAFNTAVMRRAEWSGDLAFLASPVTGGGVTVDRFSQMFVKLRQAKSPDPAAAVWAALQAQGQRIIKEGQQLATDEENLAELRARYEEFTTKRLPILQQLGIA